MGNESSSSNSASRASDSESLSPDDTRINGRPGGAGAIGPSPTFKQGEASTLNTSIGGEIVSGQQSSSTVIAGDEEANGSRLDSVTVVRDLYSHRDMAPEQEALEILGKMYPLYSSSKHSRLFKDPEVAARHHKKLLIDLLPLLQALAAIQSRTNESSIKISERQDTINRRCWDKRTRTWHAMNAVGQVGLALNSLESCVSEAWNMQESLQQSSRKVIETVKKLQVILDSIPFEERTPELYMPVQLASSLRKDTYFHINYLARTPYYEEMPDVSGFSKHEPAQVTSINRKAMDTERLETLWVHDILPFWDAAVARRSALTLWRRGVPPRLRSYVWKLGIGNRLGLTKQQFLEFVSKYDELIRSMDSTDTTTHRSQLFAADDAEVSVTMISDGEDENQDSSFPPTVPSEVDVVPENPEFVADRLKLWGPQPSLNFYDTIAQFKDLVQPIQVDPGTKAPPSEISLVPEIDAFMDARTSLGPLPDSSFYPTHPVNTTVPLVQKANAFDLLHGQQSNVPGSHRSKSYHITKTKSHLPALTSQIKLDLSRTFSKLKIYSEPEPNRDILLVLEAVAYLRPNTGYVQGMTYLAGILLLYMDAADACIALSNLIDFPYLSALFTFNVPEMRRHSDLFDQLFEYNLPALHAHFKKLDISDEHYLMDWHLTIFSKAFPIPVVSRIWDCVLLEGPLFIHLATLGILKLCQMNLLQLNFESTLDFLRKLSLDQVAGVSVSSVQQSIGAASTVSVAASPEVSSALFDSIDSIKVPSHLANLVNVMFNTSHAVANPSHPHQQHPLQHSEPASLVSALTMKRL